MSGVVGTSSAAVAALAGGFIIRKAGRKISMYLFLTISLLAATWFWFLSGSVPSLVGIYTGIILLWVAYGFSSVAIYTTSMDIVRKGREGTDFTLQIVITHLSSMMIAVFSGKLGDIIGYKGLFGIEIALCLFTFIILFYSFPKVKENGSFGEIA